MWTELFFGRPRYRLPYLTGSIAEPDSPKGSIRISAQAHADSFLAILATCAP
jgi:hypothetical protein